MTVGDLQGVLLQAFSSGIFHTVVCNSGFVDDIMFFFYNGSYSGINFATKDRFCLNLLIYRKVGQS